MAQFLPCSGFALGLPLSSRAALSDEGRPEILPGRSRELWKGGIPAQGRRLMSPYEGEMVRLQCEAAGTNSGSVASAREGQKRALSVENRREGLKWRSRELRKSGIQEQGRRLVGACEGKVLHLQCGAAGSIAYPREGQKALLSVENRREGLKWRSRELRKGGIQAQGRRLEVVRLQFGAAGSSSGSLASAREGQKTALSVEKRGEGVNAAELRTSRNPGSGVLTSPSAGDQGKGRRSGDECEPRTEVVEDEIILEALPLAFRSNSRHMYETGFSRGDRQQPGGGLQGTSPSLVATSNLDCEHFSRCSGCVIDNALDRPPILQDTANFFKKHGVIDFSWTAGSLWEWRCRAKLAVRGTSDNPLIGLFEEGSHVAVDIPSCRAHHPRINAAIMLVKEAIRSLAIEPYDEESGLGHLRYMQLAVSMHNTSIPAAERYANGKVQVTLVWNARDENSEQAKFLQAMAQFLWGRGGPKSSRPILHSVWVNFQTSRTNIIFGGKWRHLLGEEEMWERICGADICFTPASFGQANLQAFEALLKKLQTYVKRGRSVVELYAGVGVIGISLAATRACWSVKCVEINKDSKHCFERSLSRLPDEINCQISWHCADASETPISWLAGADTIIVDPPRKGLDPSVIEALRTASLRGQGKMKSPSLYTSPKVERRPWVLRANKGVTRESLATSADKMDNSWPNTLIYVSCGWQAFKQDCAALMEDDAWQLDEGHAFNLFPGTDSVEVLAVFRRGKSGKKVNSHKKIKVGKKTTSGKPAPSHR